MALLFAFAVPLAAVAAAISIDYASISSDRTRMQALADVAASVGIKAVQQNAAQGGGQF